MGLDGATHNGQICVAAHEVVGELGDKIQQPAEGLLGDLHGPVVVAEEDAVLGEIDVGGVLEVPGLPGHRQGNDPVVLTGRVVHAPGVPLVLRAQGAAGVFGVHRVAQGRCRLGVLLRLGEVDGQVQRPVGRVRLPAQIPGDPIPADVVGVAAEGIVPVGGCLGGLGIQIEELPAHLTGPGRQSAHEAGVEQIPAGGVIGTEPPGHGVVCEGGQDLCQRHGGQRGGGDIIRLLQKFQQGVAAPDGVRGFDEVLFQAVCNQKVDVAVHGDPPC